MNCTVETLATLAIISYSTPLFATLLLPLTILYFVIQKFYIASSRQLKRLDRISKSPIFSHFTETVSGAPCRRVERATGCGCAVCICTGTVDDCGELHGGGAEDGNPW